LHVERGEAVELHGAEIAARSLDPQHLDLGAGERVLLFDLGRGIAAAEIGDALVAAEQVGAVQKELGRREPRRMRVIPAAANLERRQGRLLDHGHQCLQARFRGLKYCPATPSLRRGCVSHDTVIYNQSRADSITHRERGSPCWKKSAIT